VLLLFEIPLGIRNAASGCVAAEIEREAVHDDVAAINGTRSLAGADDVFHVELVQRLGVVFEFVFVVGFAVETAVFLQRLGLFKGVDRHLGLHGLIVVAELHLHVRLALAFDLGDVLGLLRGFEHARRAFWSASARWHD
jgi:hypothetical protein